MKLEKVSIIELIVSLAALVFFSIDMTPPIPAVVRVVINLIVIAGLVFMSIFLRKKRKDKQSVPWYLIVMTVVSAVFGLVMAIVLILNA